MNCVPTPLQVSTTSSAVATPQPHYVPGYGGYVPQSKFRPGNTYGMTTHRILLDPCIHMSPRSMLTNLQLDYCTDDFGRAAVGADPLLNAQMALAKGRANSFGGGQLLQADQTRGYAGYIPKFQTILGHTYSPSCNQALASFEQEQGRNRLFNKELEALDGWRFCYKTKPWEFPEVQRTGADPQASSPSPCCPQPRFQPNDGQCSAGGCGCGGDDYCQDEREQWPRTKSCCGCDNLLNFTILTKERPSCDYGDRRMWGIATDAFLNRPVGDIIPRKNAFAVSRPPIDRIQQIYRGCEGLPPNYTGHVPGEQFRIGKTYTSSTRNARRALDTTQHTPLCYPPPFKR